MKIMIGDLLEVLCEFDVVRSKKNPTYRVINVNQLKGMQMRADYKSVIGHFPDELQAIAPSMLSLPADSTPLCRDWMKGRCPANSGTCLRRHCCVTSDEEQQHSRLRSLREKEAGIIQARLEKDEVDGADIDPFDQDDKALKGQRTVIFAQWLVDTMGKERLNAGAKVVLSVGKAKTRKKIK